MILTSSQRERVPLGGKSNPSEGRERIPDADRYSPPRISQQRTPPEDQIPRGCSLHSMEPLRDWFCKGADMTSAAEYEAALVQLEEDPPDIRQYNTNIREERWTNFSLEGVRFPAMTVDVIQRGEALAIFERDLIIHFQQISRAATLYVRALMGGVKRALEIYRRVDETTKNFPWSVPTTEEKWHVHAEGVLMVALTTLNLPVEAWKSARLLRAVPNCRSSIDACIPHAQPSAKCGRDWFDGLSPVSARGRIIYCTSDIWTSELEMCWEKTGGDRGKTPYCHTVASVFHKDTHQALGGQQETELHVSTTVEYYPDDESKSDRDCRIVRVC